MSKGPRARVARRVIGRSVHHIPSTLTLPGLMPSMSEPIPTKPTLMERMKALLPEYGEVAVVTYFAIFGLVFAGFTLAIRFSVQTDSAAGWAGTIGAAYGATKLTQPLRILATLLLTPLLARLVRRKKATPPPKPE